MEGMTTVTSREVNLGFSGIGIGRNLLNANTFTIKRRYRYMLVVSMLVDYRIADIQLTFQKDIQQWHEEMETGKHDEFRGKQVTSVL